MYVFTFAVYNKSTVLRTYKMPFVLFSLSPGPEVICFILNCIEHGYYPAQNVNHCIIYVTRHAKRDELGVI